LDIFLSTFRELVSYYLVTARHRVMETRWENSFWN